ncbi:c-type cytochrome [Bordetella sp. 15P40C-2]|nr:c-type cytochrome [Bordetella sp. 15P40C-2]
MKQTITSATHVPRLERHGICTAVATRRFVPLHRSTFTLYPCSVVVVLASLAGCDPSGPSQGGEKATADLLTRADPSRGRTLIVEKGCVACHVVPGVRAPVSFVGPPLDGLRQQAYVAGRWPNNVETLVRWLQDPPAMNPETAMPNVGLTSEEAEHITAYLLTLP